MTTEVSPSGLTKKARKGSSDSKKFSRLEANIAKLASAVESSTNLMVKVVERVDGLEGKIQGARKLPLIQSSEARLEAMKQVTKPGDIAERQRVEDFVNPRGHEGGFQENDIVKLNESADLAFRTYRLDERGEPAKGDGEQALGVVLSYMYTRRDGQRKYKVNFPKFGKSGFLEKELTLVKAA